LNNTPKNIEVVEEYEPDMARMVKALLILLEYNSVMITDQTEQAS